MMIEPKELLSPTATLFAVIFAIFVFLFMRALAMYRERQITLSEVDVPDYIRKRLGFKIGALGDVLLLFLSGVLLLVLGIVYCPALLYRIANFYLGSEMFSSAQILSDFRGLTLWFGILSSVVLAAVLALFSNEVFVSKRLPTIVRVYIGSVLGRRATKAEADSLLPEARILYEKDAFGESVLHSMASLELALRNKLDLPAGVGFGRLLGGVVDKLGGVISPEELLIIRRVRNIAAHPSPERRVTKQDAEQVLHLVENILWRLQPGYHIILRPDAQEELNKITEQGRMRVAKAMSTLEQEPRPRGAKKLAKENLWVIRGGQYRVVYEIDEARHQVTVVRIDRRTEGTYKNL
jgi:mRNA interferase RelE/StbE